jgi:hypothetical protein
LRRFLSEAEQGSKQPKQRNAYYISCLHILKSPLRAFLI